MTIPAVLVEPSQSHGTACVRAQDQTLYDWVANELVDALDIQKQLTRALRRMAIATRAADVRQALAWHLEATRERVDLLRGVLADLDRVAADAHGGIIASA